jgi:serine-type D-Ala-D-Ala carboxypeptidase/endopeptidase (penicillin-binding protein 4)
VCAAACGGSSHSDNGSGTALKSAAPARAGATHGDPAAGDGAEAGPGRTRLRARITHDLSTSGSRVGVLVFDLSGNAPLMARNQRVGRAPASLEKLYTSVVMLQMLGPQARLHTTIVGSGHMAAHGVWHGNIFLVGGGDPTLGDGAWNQAYDGGYGPTLTELVAQLRRDGIRRVTGKVYGDEALFDTDRGGPLTHNRPDIPDYDGELSALVFDHGASAKGYSPATFAAHELVLTMRDSGIRTAFSRRSGVAPTHARLLAKVSSPPLQTMLRIMDTYSDDLFADLFAKQLGHRFFGGKGTLAKGAIEIRQELASKYGLHPVIHDGSGLDKADRSSPAQIVDLLTQIWHTPVGRDLRSDMAVVGKSGTVESLGIGSYATGHCVAKTGTLNNVTNLAGYCNTRGGHTLAFAVMVDGPSNAEALPVLSRVVSAIAAY